MHTAKMSGVRPQIVNVSTIPSPTTLASVQTIFDSPVASIGSVVKSSRPSASCAAAHRKSAIQSQPSTYGHLVRKLHRIGSVWAIPACGVIDSPVLDVDLGSEEIAGDILASDTLCEPSSTNAESDTHLNDTSPIQSDSFTSLLLSKVANSNELGHSKPGSRLCEDSIINALVTAAVLADELRQTAAATSGSTHHTLTTKHQNLQISKVIATRRGINLGKLDLPQWEVGEYDLTLLNHKTREDPDFQAAPYWHDEYSAIRTRLDALIKIEEYSHSDIFAYEFLCKKCLHEFNAVGLFPHAAKLRVVRSSAENEASKMMTAEIEQSHAQEPKRLLRDMIEQQLSRMTLSKAQFKFVRLIELNTLLNAGILDMSEKHVVKILYKKKVQDPW
ncbi:hypothetical protein T440DRAFT_512018 [Plenodomus tracheiphilus IPT5]|uniref:Uncharacterized protein n=1 Tax=Plenodomus tracheiphilus IPT5 TaxID=1408161 RepID=A0A6A7ANY0_9PLEO|nr:hypothetical protein T440DRAFT_512018 [Plenodomus tracheiphilus IPT5]